MKIKRSIIIWLCITTMLHPETPSTFMSPPQLRFTYDWRGKTIDVIGCYLLASKFGFKNVGAQDIKQLKKKMPEVKAAWQQEATILFSEVLFWFNKSRHKKWGRV